MRGLASRLCLFFCLFLMVVADEDYCLYFPLELNKSWQYESESFPFTMNATITDTMSINGQLYYNFALYGEENNWSTYWLRPESNTILALNPVDLSEYLLFNLSSWGEPAWTLPPVIVPPMNQPLNQCDWGSNITASNSWETVYGSNRTYFLTHGFIHTNHPCTDAGIATTHFSRDFGLVGFSQITEGGAVDWTLVIPDPDTLSVTGSFSIEGKPCLSNPCVPGIVGALQGDSLRYILAINDLFIQDGMLVWNNTFIHPGDSIGVTGFTTQRQDIWGDTYVTLEILGLSLLDLSPVEPRNSFEIPEKTHLFQNYPNPFNPETTLLFSIAAQGFVTVSIYNVNGESIKTLTARRYSAGTHELRWDGTGFQGGPVSGGLYFAQLESVEASDVIKLILLK